jgi:hypothetical protein
MRRHWILAALGSLALAGIVERQAAAQTGGTVGGTNTQGIFGSRNLGLSQGTVPGSSGTATGTGFGTGLTTGQGGPVAQGAGAAATAGFVGADSADVVNLRSAQGTTGARRTTQSGLQNIFQQFSQDIATAQRNQGQQGRNQPNIRVSLRLGFQPAPASSVQFEAFTQRLTKLPGIRLVGPMEATLEGKTAVLRGIVASEADRDLAEALALMEPGVRDVRNELVVDPSGARAEELPPVSVTPQ